MGHLYQSGRTKQPLFRYGFTWVPYYFMMSGYVLTLSAMKREAKTRKIPDFGPRYLQARLKSMYPIYLAAIFLSVSTTWFLFGQSRLPENTDFLCHVFLLQAWSPGMVERGLVNMVHTWFLSALLFYWLLFGKVYHLITHKISSDLRVCALAGGLILPGLIYHISVNQFDPWWYKDHKYMRESKFTDAAVLFLKYHPFAYLHIFVFGCCLPRVQRHTHKYRLLRVFISHGATCALSAIFLLFSFRGNVVPSYKLSLRLGLLVPLHGLLLLGLSSKADLVTYIFGMPILRLYGASYGYPQYVMQTIVVNWVDSFRDKQKIISYEYNVLLLSASILAFHAVRSINTFLAHRKTGSNIFLFGVTVILASYIVLQKPLVATSTSSRHSIQGIHNDVLIDFANQTHPPVMEGISEQYTLINPSLLRFPHEYFSTAGEEIPFFFAARESRQDTSAYTVFDHKLSLQRWFSKIRVGHLNGSVATVSQSLAPRVFGEELIPCSPPPLCGNSKQVFSKIVNGPEDPKLFMHRGIAYMSVFSYHHSSLLSNKRGNSIARSCSESFQGGMYMIKLMNMASYRGLSSESIDAIPVMLTNMTTWGKEVRLSLVNSKINIPLEKNWGAFTAESNGLPWLHWTYQIYPLHIILRSTRDPGDAFDLAEPLLTEPAYIENSTSAFKSSPAFSVKDDGTIFFISGGITVDEVHGNVNPIEVLDPETNMHIMISIFHVRTAAEHNYASFFYAFEKTAPFRILRIGSKALPVKTDLSSKECEAPSVFVSGIILEHARLHDTSIVATYSVCDTETRMLKMNISEIFQGYMREVVGGLIKV